MCQKLRKVIIGYSDDDGYDYCISHANSSMEAIFEGDSDNLNPKCEVCGKVIQDLYWEEL